MGKVPTSKTFFNFRQKARILEEYAARPYPVILETGVQNYAWGQRGEDAFIPNLLGIPAGDSPYAEVWIGAHPDLPSTAILPKSTKIDMGRLVERAGEGIMSPHARGLYNGQLPFLFKVLAAGKPLSIQVHPNAEQAQAGFDRENQEGIDVRAGNRNYKDPNHKPELIVAVTEFYGLRGFRPLNEIAGAINANAELMTIQGATDFVSVPSEGNLKTLYGNIMGLPQEQVNTILSPLIQRLREVNNKTPFPKNSAEYWVLRSDAEFSTEGHHDRGVFSVYLLNLIRLNPGQAMYLSAGVPHAYLDGVGMEIMANSNNVLRGGLTPKHVDVPELMNTVVFQGEPPLVRDGVQVAETETVYRELGDVPEFQLSRINIAMGQNHNQPPYHDVETLIVLEAEMPLLLQMDDGSKLTLTRGQTVMVPKGIGYRIVSTKGEATLFRATVPVQPMAMDGMPYQAKEDKAKEIFEELQTLQQQLNSGAIEQRGFVVGVGRLVSGLFELQRDGNLGDVIDVAGLVINNLESAGISSVDIQGLFVRPYTIRLIRETSRQISSGEILGYDNAGNPPRVDSGYVAQGGMAQSEKTRIANSFIVRLALATTDEEVNAIASNFGRIEQAERADILRLIGMRSGELRAEWVEYRSNFISFADNLQRNGVFGTGEIAGQLNNLIKSLNNINSVMVGSDLIQPVVDVPKAAEDILSLIKTGKPEQAALELIVLGATKSRGAQIFRRMNPSLGEPSMDNNWNEFVGDLLRLIKAIPQQGSTWIQDLRLAASETTKPDPRKPDAFVLDIAQIAKDPNYSQKLFVTLSRFVSAHSNDTETDRKKAYQDQVDSLGRAILSLDAAVAGAGLIGNPYRGRLIRTRRVLEDVQGALKTALSIDFALGQIELPGIRQLVVDLREGRVDDVVGSLNSLALEDSKMAEAYVAEVGNLLNDQYSREYLGSSLGERSRQFFHAMMYQGQTDHMRGIADQAMSIHMFMVKIVSSQEKNKYDLLASYANIKLTGETKQRIVSQGVTSYLSKKTVPRGTNLKMLIPELRRREAQNLIQAMIYFPNYPAFGTSGVRGPEHELTDLAAYAVARTHFSHLGSETGSQIYFGGDNRPSTKRMETAVARAILDMEGQPFYCGRIPTPFLTYVAMQAKGLFFMVTGSHIKTGLNGMKGGSAVGETTPDDNATIARLTAEKISELVYRRTLQDSQFDDYGLLKPTRVPRPDQIRDYQKEARETSERRYSRFFGPVAGLPSAAFYEHSAVGREMVQNIVRVFLNRSKVEKGISTVVGFGATDDFVPVDTEGITQEQLNRILAIFRQLNLNDTVRYIFSTDGDSDRPLVLVVVRNGDQISFRFVPGDVLVALTAVYLKEKSGARNPHISLPNTVNPGVVAYLEREGFTVALTDVGSPYVIASMNAAVEGGQYDMVVGGEANGGFLTATKIGNLEAVPTRDATVVELAVLSLAGEKKRDLLDIVDNDVRPLPGESSVVRYEFGEHQKEFNAIMQNTFSPTTNGIIVDKAVWVEFSNDGSVVLLDDNKDQIKVWNAESDEAKLMVGKKRLLEGMLANVLADSPIVRMNFKTGIKCYLADGEVVNFRGSGNDKEIRQYFFTTPERGKSRANQAGRLSRGEATEGVSEAEREALGRTQGRGVLLQIVDFAKLPAKEKETAFLSASETGVKPLIAKPYSTARKLAVGIPSIVFATGVGFIFVANAIPFVGGLLIWSLGLLAVIALPYTGVALMAYRALKVPFEGEGNIKDLADGFRRFSYDPTFDQNSNEATLKIGKRTVTVKFGRPTDARWFAETTRTDTTASITVRPETPAWLLPIVLSQEIYRVDWWKGVQSTFDFLLGLPDVTSSPAWWIAKIKKQAADTDTRAPPDQPTADMTRVASITLAGGASSRFWPLNKTLSELSGMGVTMIQATFRRVTEKISGAFSSFIDVKNFFIVAGSDVETPLKNQLPDMPLENLLIEPGRRNTLPAILFAMANIKKQNPNATLTMLTADHIIPDTEQFRRTMDKAIALAQDPKANNIVTIGINPIDLKTGEVAPPAEWTPFGAIEANTQSQVGVGYKIKLFTEKPSAELAGQMVQEQETGDATRYWNSGMLVFSIESMEKALEKFQPELFAKYEALVKAIQDGEMENARNIFNSFPSKIKHPTEDRQVHNSVDYALLVPMTLETEDSGVQGIVVPGSFEWIDIGSFDALRKVKSIPTDEHGNRRIGAGSTTGSKDTILVADTEREIAVEGVDDVAVVFSNMGQLLVIQTSLAQGVKNVKEAYDKDSETPTVVWDSKMTIQADGAGVTVIGADSQKVRVLGVENISITFEGNKVTVRNTALFPTRPALLSVTDQVVPAATVQQFGREKGVKVEPVQTPNTLPSFIRYSGEGTVAPPAARAAKKFDTLTADVFLRANAYWTDGELGEFTQWARTPKNKPTAQKLFLDVAFTLARLHGHNRTSTGNYSAERQRNEMIALAVLADQMGMSDESRSHALGLYSREAAVQTIAARNNENGRVDDVQHQFMLAPVVRGEDGNVGWDPAAGEDGINRWKKELREAEEKATVTLFLMSGDTSITPSELEGFLKAQQVESRGPMQGTFFVHQGNYLTDDGRIDFGGVVGSLAPVHKILTSGTIAIVSMYENRFSFDNMPEGFARENLLVYIINMLGKLTQAGTSIETDVNSLRLSFIAA
ncbi:MAG: mannose-6-phosphate isomerase, class I [Elusimicrobia bacterium]|nr:mannose-6-phosphate isomerase, class I [Elusimicrobiota bacterium]